MFRLRTLPRTVSRAARAAPRVAPTVARRSIALSSLDSAQAATAADGNPSFVPFRKPIETEELEAIETSVSFTPGQKLNDRWEVVRKLGWGRFSDVWCAKDTQSSETRLVAIKVLTSYYTSLIREGHRWEQTVLNNMATFNPNAHCLKSLQQFTVPALDGERLCIVTELMGGSMLSLVENLPTDKKLPFGLAKKVMHNTLQGLAELHCLGFAHTDLKPVSIMYGLDKSQPHSAILERIEKAGPAGTKSELPPVEDLQKRRFYISDLGSAQKLDQLTVHRTTTYPMRAPEMLLQGPWDHKVDIWSFGCLAAELLIGQPLFLGSARLRIDENIALLWEHMIVSGDNFSWEMLNRCRMGHKYFKEGPTGAPVLRNVVPTSTYKLPVAAILEKFGTLVNADFPGDAARERNEVVARFIGRCLRLDPKDRPKALELLEDPFFQLPVKP